MSGLQYKNDSILYSPGASLQKIFSKSKCSVFEDKDGHFRVELRGAKKLLQAGFHRQSEPLPDFRKRGKITVFSKKSKMRACFVVNNSEGLVSQFLLTYQEPIYSGKQTKKHLNTFLTRIRQLYPGVKYFWFLEFQERGTPHYHVFLSLPVTRKISKQLARTWCSASDQLNPEVYRFHAHPKNFIDWEPQAGYVAKYLGKDYQKDVPEEFSDVGRFWGNSRGLVKKKAELIICQEIFRICRKFIEKKIGRKIKSKKIIIKNSILERLLPVFPSLIIYQGDKKCLEPKKSTPLESPSTESLWGSMNTNTMAQPLIV